MYYKSFELRAIVANCNNATELKHAYWLIISYAECKLPKAYSLLLTYLFRRRYRQILTIN